jgi:DNA-binding transcriptional regulator YiaG
MPSPLIRRLKYWRRSNNLSQAEAVKVLIGEGLPIALTTLQQWEIGRRSPQPVTAVALERFLAKQEKISALERHKTAAPVIERLKAWRQANNLSQTQAVEVMLAAGLPVKLKTLQGWESGRHSPQPIAAAALERFLDQHPTIDRSTSR